MAVRTFRAGAIKVYLPEDTQNELGSLNGLTFTAASAAQTDYLNTDIATPLELGASYTFILTLAGRDTTNSGITHTRGTAASSAVIVGSSGTRFPSGILLQADIADLQAIDNFEEAYGIGIWISKNGGNYKLLEYGMIDQENDWAHMVTNEAAVDALARTSTFLTAAISASNQDTEVGDRHPYGMTHVLAGISQGGVTVEDTAENLQYRPDTSTNYSLATAHGFKVSFAVLNNSPRDIVSAGAGQYSEFTAGDGSVHRQVKMARQTVAAIATGNRPIKLIYPIDNRKGVEELWMLGALRENQVGGSANWGKDEPPTTSYEFDTINEDACLQDVPSVIRRTRTTS